ncbi:unnamed protein product, partial [Ixodes hexagonus]
EEKPAATIRKTTRRKGCQESRPSDNERRNTERSRGCRKMPPPTALGQLKRSRGGVRLFRHPPPRSQRAGRVTSRRSRAR